MVIEIKVVIGWFKLHLESDWLITSKVIGFLNDNKLYANNLASE